MISFLCLLHTKASFYHRFLFTPALTYLLSSCFRSTSRTNALDDIIHTLFNLMKFCRLSTTHDHNHCRPQANIVSRQIFDTKTENQLYFLVHPHSRCNCKLGYQP